MAETVSRSDAQAPRYGQLWIICHRTQGAGCGARRLNRLVATLRYLPQYSPIFNPIENCFSKITKRHLRKAVAKKALPADAGRTLYSASKRGETGLPAKSVRQPWSTRCLFARKPLARPPLICSYSVADVGGPTSGQTSSRAQENGIQRAGNRRQSGRREGALFPPGAILGPARKVVLPFVVVGSGQIKVPAASAYVPPNQAI